MVQMLRYPAVAQVVCRRQLAGRVSVAVLLCLSAWPSLDAQAPKRHYRHSGNMPPGAIGRSQLQRGGPLPGYFQPVQITAPAGATVSLAVGGTFEPPRPAPRTVGLLIGQVYRFKVTHIPQQAGREVFPSVEVIDRLYPPPGKEYLFPIPVQLTEAELNIALSGKLVTRVIFLENPRSALPVRETEGFQNWFEAAKGDDPLQIADLLGRPVAILRLGARVPDRHGPNEQFLYGSPPFQQYAKIVEIEDQVPEPLQSAAGLPDRSASRALESGTRTSPEPAYPWLPASSTPRQLLVDPHVIPQPESDGGEEILDESGDPEMIVPPDAPTPEDLSQAPAPLEVATHWHRTGR